MQVVYGRALSVPEPTLQGPALPVLPPLPTEHSPVPRRRRTIVCSNLTVDGEPMAQVDSPTWEATLPRLRDALGIERGGRTAAALRCSNRPGVEMEPDWTLDLCCSSWSRTCPFRVAQ